MKLIVVCCALVAGICAAPTSKDGPYEGNKILELVPSTREQVELLERVREDGANGQVDFWGSPHINRSLFVRVTPEAETEFNHLLDVLEIKYEVKIENVQELVDLEHISNLRQRTSRDVSTMAVGSYASSSEINTLMDNLARTYGRIMSVRNLGSSFEGRALKVAKFSSGSGKPSIFINGGFHSREWIAHASVVWIMNEIATQYGKDTAITELVDKFDVYIMPLANPDGYDYSRDKARFWRKTRSTTSKAGCFGADPNRNWDINFGGEGTSDSPCSDIYHGSHAFSEPETSAMYRFLTSLEGELKLYVDIHAFTQLWLTPYGYKNQRPSDYAEIDRVANIGAKAIEKVNGKKFTIGTPPSLLYPAAGGAFDWAKQELGVKYTYALELRPAAGGLFGFIVPASEIPDSGRETLAGLFAAAMAMDI